METWDFVGEARSLLKVDSRRPLRLASRESQRLELKKSFSWNSRSEYAKTMAGFANNSGGCIVFGIHPRPHDLIGVNDAFTRLDDSKVSTYLSNVLAPEIDWSRFTLELSGVELGVIGVAPCRTGPVIALKNDGELREAALYYRYRAQTTHAKYPEVRRLIDSIVEREREGLLRLMTRLVTVGSAESAVLDFQNAELVGRSGHLVVSEDTLNKVKFIKEGSFNEKEGAPTLRVLSDVVQVPSGSISVSRSVDKPIAVNEPSIFTTFLRQAVVESPEVFLHQICVETSAYLPMYFYAAQAQMNIASLRSLIEQTAPRPHIRRQLMERCDGKIVRAMGSIVSNGTTAEERRLTIRAIEAGDEATLRSVSVQRLLESITHLEQAPSDSVVFNVLLDIIECDYSSMDSALRSVLRKSISFLDELQNREAVTNRR